MYKYIKNYSKTKGFEMCGITRAEYDGNYNRYMEEWIKKGYNAGMEWMERNGNIRKNLSLLVENARTVIMVAKYYNDRNYDLATPRIARYSQRTDYHIIFRNSLNQILDTLRDKYGASGRVFVDSAPVLERYWAKKAGLGWIGRNGSLINKKYGAFILLGGIIIDKECDTYDKPDEFNGCGKCRRCVENCPTNALMNDGTVDCNRCISYLTIEHKGEFTDTEKNLVKENGWFYGCDICTEVCPWSISASERFGITDLTRAPYSRKEFLSIPGIPNSGFKKMFGSTPLYHSGKKNISRNIILYRDNCEANAETLKK